MRHSLLSFALLTSALAAACTAPESGDAIDDDFLSDGKSDGAISEGSPDALGVLAVVNTLDKDALDDDVGLDTRAATGIAKHRAGADNATGTSDDDRFDTLAELDKVPYVGKTAFAKLLAYARAHDFVPQPVMGRQISSCPGSTLAGNVYPGTAVCGDAAWQREMPALTGQHLRAAWTFSESDVWVAGSQGTMLHFDGTTWTSEQTPVCESLAALWGTSATNLWAVGDYGRIIHRTSAGWQIVDSGTCASLSTVWGTSATDVWISGAGSDAATLHGGTQGFTADASIHLESMWGFASDDVWGVESGLVYHYNGAAWSIALQGHWAFHSIWGSDPDHLFVGGFDWDKNTAAVWMFSESTAATPVQKTFSGNTTPAVRGSAANDVWFAEGETLYHYDGTTWTYTGRPGIASLRAVAVASPTDAWAVGQSGDILHWDGTAWSTGNQSHALFGMWASSTSDAWAASSAGLRHYDGHAWTTVPGVSGFYYSVWGTSSSNVYAAGLFGKVQHFDGTSWSLVTMPSSQSWYTIAGTSANDVWIAGYKGALAHFDGTTWSAPPSPTSRNIYALSTFAPNDVWAATEDGLLHFDGSGWAVSGPLNTGKMLHVWGTSPNDLWAVGYGVWHYNGNVWTKLLTAPGTWYEFSSVWGTGPSDVWVAMGIVLSGAPSHLLHWDGAEWTTHVNAAADRVRNGLSIGNTTWAAETSGGIVRLAQ